MKDRGEKITLLPIQEGSVPDSVDLTTIAVSPPRGLGEQVRSAFERALADEGKISDDVLNLPGGSGRKYRRFINNLLELIANPHYLEIGVWQGSTLCSAIYENDVTATAIDNWSEHGGPFDKFFMNLSKFKGTSRVNFLETDFREVDFSQIGKFNVYLFDGPHSYQDQFDGITLADPALIESFVLIVDDWNWDQVRRGTLDAVRANNYHIDYMIEIRTTRDNSYAQVEGAASDWHNGYLIAALRKST
jgi:hypothetical protein